MSASYYHPEWADGEEYHSSQEHAGQSDEDSFASANDEGIDEDDDDENDLDFENGDEDLDEDEEVDEEDEDDEDDDDEDGGHFHDENGDPISFEVVIDPETGNQIGGTSVGVRIGESTIRLTHRQIISLLSGHGVDHSLFDDDDVSWMPSRVRRRPAPDPNRFPKVPSAKGRELMESGAFGSIDPRVPPRKRLARRILDRELGLGDRFSRGVNQDLMAQQMIPSTNPEMIIHYGDPACCGQFSDDGNFFYACVNDFRVRMYDTSNPYNWRYYKTVTYPFGQWRLTDAHLSPDNKWLAYTSLQTNVCFAPTDPNDVGDPYTLDMADALAQGGNHRRGNFAIFSVRFSGDGRNLVVGTGADSIIVYDIESRRVLHHVAGHDNDVNAVCFADKSSPHILYSGSDDCTIKVWDTRSMGDGRESGAFVGHIEGLTYIDSKGDGRYILSNGKDQSMKLWDLRMAMSTSRYEELDPTKYTRQRLYDYDYRWEDYDDREWFQHKHDNSLVTFRGHKVQRTLIRCHFSPPGSTNSRYVYSGSQDGYVYVWNLDATLAGKIDVRSATEGKRIGDGRYHLRTPRLPRSRDWRTLVRDVGWHPNAPLLVASSWNGPTMNSGTCTLHSYNESTSDEAEPGMGISLNERLVADPSMLMPDSEDDEYE